MSGLLEHELSMDDLPAGARSDLGTPSRSDAGCGLGAAPEATIADAREAVLEAAQRVAAGIAGAGHAQARCHAGEGTGAGIEELGRLAPGWLDA